MSRTISCLSSKSPMYRLCRTLPDTQSTQNDSTDTWSLSEREIQQTELCILWICAKTRFFFSYKSEEMYHRRRATHLRYFAYLQAKKRTSNKIWNFLAFFADRRLAVVASLSPVEEEQNSSLFTRYFWDIRLVKKRICFLVRIHTARTV